MNHIKNIHFVGIGGSGMCGIAEVLFHEGYFISGSDLVSNSVTEHLVALGIGIFFKHCASNVRNVHVLVVSSAISSSNPEVVAAKQLGIPVIKRAEMLSELMRYRYGIAVSGTHGKTTTTSMISSIYIKAGLNPTIINGGFMKDIKTYAKLGSNHYLIAEADESDASFLYLHPIVAVVTSIGFDHLNNHDNNILNLQQSFINFLHNLPFYGYAVLCLDDKIICDSLLKINRKIITYGFNNNADFCIFNYFQNQIISSFFVRRKNSSLLPIVLNIPGKHNALNATAAIAVATCEGILDDDIIQSMLQFKGTSRRFDYIDNYSLQDMNNKDINVTLVEDYGHHPTEIRATIDTIRNGWPDKRLVMIFQPHRFTRLRDLYQDFVNVLSSVDVLLLLNVFSAGESPILGYDSYSLCCNIKYSGVIDPILVVNIEQIHSILSLELQDNDLILIQGAGEVDEIIRKLNLNKLRS